MTSTPQGKKRKVIMPVNGVPQGSSIWTVPTGTPFDVCNKVLPVAEDGIPRSKPAAANTGGHGGGGSNGDVVDLSSDWTEDLPLALTSTEYVNIPSVENFRRYHALRWHVAGILAKQQERWIVNTFLDSCGPVFIHETNASQFARQATTNACTPIALLTVLACLTRDRPFVSTVESLESAGKSILRIRAEDTERNPEAHPPGAPELMCEAQLSRMYLRMMPDMHWSAIRDCGGNLFSIWDQAEAAEAKRERRARRTWPHIANLLQQTGPALEQYMQSRDVCLRFELAGMIQPLDAIEAAGWTAVHPLDPDKVAALTTEDAAMDFSYAVYLMRRRLAEVLAIELSGEPETVEQPTRTELGAVLTFRDISVALLFMCESRKDPERIIAYLADSHGVPETRGHSYMARFRDPFDMHVFVSRRWAIRQPTPYSLAVFSRTVRIDSDLHYLLLSDI